MNKKPTQLKVIEGNRGKRPLPENEPKPQPIAPEMPKELDAGAKKTWSRLSSIILPLGLLTEADGDLFAALCQTRSRLLQIWTRLKKITTETNFNKRELKKIETGEDPDASLGAVIIENIATLKSEQAYLMKEERLYFAAFRKFASDFGLSPRARVGLTVQGDDDKDEGRDLLS